MATYVGRITALRDEFASIMVDLTGEASIDSQTNHVFMILALLCFGSNFDNIQEHILLGLAVSTFDDTLAIVFHHSSTTLDHHNMIAQ